MPYESLTLGLTLTLPTPGTRNWGPTIKSTTWTKISQHAHTGSGDGQKLGTSSLNLNIIGKAQLALNVAFTQAATLTPAGTTQTVDFNLGNIQKLDMGSASGNITLTFSNPIEGGYYRLFVIQAATPRTLTFPATVKWPQAQAPILSTANDAIDVIEFYYDGANYFGQWDVAYA